MGLVVTIKQFTPWYPKSLDIVPMSDDVCLIFIVDCAMLLVHAVYDP